MAKHVAVVLSGCGFKDGSEVTEVVAAFIALSECGSEVKVFAPNEDGLVKNHIDDQNQGVRNIMQESSRISRGEIEDIKNLSVNDFDGVVFPGGFGAALNLSDFAQKGEQCCVHEEVKRVVLEFNQNSKPIVAFCIAPVIIAKVLGDQGVAVTIGNDADTATLIEKMGAQHVECKVDDYVSDRALKVITTPAYMYNAKPHEVFKGIKAAINEFIEMA